MNSFQLSCLADFFYKCAAIKFPEELSWVPQEIRENKLLSDYPKDELQKVFKDYGLEDFRIQINIKDFLAYEKFYTKLLEITGKLPGILYNFEYDLKNKKNIQDNGVTAAKAQLLKVIGTDFYNALLEIRKENKTDLKLPVNIRTPQNEVRFDAGTSIIKIYNYIREKLSDLNITKKERGEDIKVELPDINTLQEFRDISHAKGIFYFVFSTKLEDLVGISSRGIRSCQSLHDEQGKCFITDHNQKLIGTILSRYIGVCYITSGTNYEGRGEKMLYRALIRQVLDLKSGNPVIIVDKLYPSQNDIVSNIMRDELAKKSSISVISLPENMEDYEFEYEDIPTEYESYTDYEYSLPMKELLKRRTSKDSDYRMGAAKKLPVEYIIEMMNDTDYAVRAIVASRIPVEHLSKMMYDSNRNVREIVVERIPKEYLKYFINDGADNVMRALIERLSDNEIIEILNAGTMTLPILSGIIYNFQTTFNNDSILNIYSRINDFTTRYQILQKIFEPPIPFKLKNSDFLLYLMEIENNMKDRLGLSLNLITYMARFTPEILSRPIFYNNPSGDVRLLTAEYILPKHFNLMENDSNKLVKDKINSRKHKETKNISVFDDT